MEFKELWADLPTDVRSQFERDAKTMILKRGDFIYSQGDAPQGLYFVNQGLVGLIKLGFSGREHLLRFFRQGQFFGHRALFSKEGYHGSTVALEPTTLKLVPQESVQSALQKNPHLLWEVVTVLSKELRRCEEQHVMILENEILPRVAQAIVYLKDLHPQHSWTRQEIANFCASTVSTVIKALAKLEALHLIVQEGRSIQIVDRNALILLQEEVNPLER